MFLNVTNLLNLSKQIVCVPEGRQREELHFFPRVMRKKWHLLLNLKFWRHLVHFAFSRGGKQKVTYDHKNQLPWNDKLLFSVLRQVLSCSLEHGNWIIHVTCTKIVWGPSAHTKIRPASMPPVHHATMHTCNDMFISSSIYIHNKNATEMEKKNWLLRIFLSAGQMEVSHDVFSMSPSSHVLYASPDFSYDWLTPTLLSFSNKETCLLVSLKTLFQNILRSATAWQA